MANGIRSRDAAALLLLTAAAAQAACPIDVAHVRVGTSGPPYCSYGDIQSAIDAAGSCPVVIDITREGTIGGVYPNQHLNISGKNVTLQGWGDDASCYTLSQCLPYPCGAPAATNPLITLNGGDSGSVLTISGTQNVNLRNLTITHGDGGSAGGGVHWSGAGNLNIFNSTFNYNSGAFGGAISFEGSGGNAFLRLFDNTLILSNTAQSAGGGIYVTGSARLYALKPQTYIASNSAGNDGGGIAVVAPARADIASAGYNGAGVIAYNQADNGGGVAAIGSNAGDATLRLFTVDPAHPVQIENNVAAVHGGAVYLTTSGEFATGVLCAFDFRLDHNAAADGAAVYADTHPQISYPDNGGHVYLNTVPDSDPYCGPESPPSLGAVECATDAPCSELRDNQAVDLDAIPTSGSVIRLTSGALLVGDPFQMRANAAAQLITATGSSEGGAYVTLRNCLIADNHTQHELISIRDGRSMGLNGCTIAGNTIDNGYQIYASVAENGLTLVNSIFDQPGVSVLDYNGDNSVRGLSYLIANETATLAGADHTEGNTPVYVDAAHGDYHLAPNSPGVDYAPAQAGSDLDGLPRTVDLAPITDRYGPRDLGAYERQDAFACDGAADAIFCSTFEP